MSYLRNYKKYYQIVFTLIPMLFSIAFVLFRSVLLLVLTAVSLFVTVGAVPIFRKRENLWMFLLAAFIMIPINLYMIFALFSIDSLAGYDLIYKILYGGMLYCVFFSAEEILFGFITRLIWKKQYKISI